MPRKPRYVNPVTGQRMNRKTGRFQKKLASDKKPVVPIQAGRTLMQALGDYADVDAVARKIHMRAMRDGDPSMLQLLMQAAELKAQSSAASQEQGDFSDFTVEDLKLFKLLLDKRLHKLDAYGQRYLDRTRTPSAYEMSLSDKAYEAEVYGEAEEEPDEQEAKPNQDPDVVYGFKLPDAAPTPAPPKPSPPQRHPLSRLPERYTDAVLDASKPTTGGRRPSLLGFDKNDAMSPFGYDDRNDDYDFQTDPNDPPQRKAN